MKAALILFVACLSVAGRACAFLGDDKATIDRLYGAPVIRVTSGDPTSDDPDEQIWSYRSKGYKVLITFRGGRSVEESFYKIDLRSC